MVLLFTVGGLAVISYVHGKTEIVRLETRLEQEQKKSKDLQASLDQMFVLSEGQAKRLEAATTERIVVMKKMASDINSLKNQRPPKDCSAIDWSIKNKGDLSWPVSQ